MGRIKPGLRHFVDEGWSGRTVTMSGPAAAGDRGASDVPSVSACGTISNWIDWIDVVEFSVA